MRELAHRTSTDACPRKAHIGDDVAKSRRPRPRNAFGANIRQGADTPRLPADLWRHVLPATDMAP